MHASIARVTLFDDLFAGEIPASVSRLVSLVVLRLGGNQLKGERVEGKAMKGVGWRAIRLYVLKPLDTLPACLLASRGTIRRMAGQNNTAAVLLPA